MKRFWASFIGISLFLVASICCIWFVTSNIRYHFFPVPYEIVARGQLPYTDKSINEVRMSVISSGSHDFPIFPVEITSALNKVDFREKIAIVIENQVHKPYTETSPNIRRVIDISNERIHIESLLHRSPNYETSTTSEAYNFVILTFDKRDHWADEMEFYLFNDEQDAAYVKTKIR